MDEDSEMKIQGGSASAASTTTQPDPPSAVLVQNNSPELQVSFSSNSTGDTEGAESAPPSEYNGTEEDGDPFQGVGVGGMELVPYPAASQPSGSATNPDLPDTKEGFEELCPVCGDKVSGYHYGLLTCESCKGFFKRTVQNKKVYTCVADRTCHIDKTQRKRCPFCRFQKCLEVGMKLEAVRADRMRGGRNKFGPMYKRDRARKLQMMRQRQIALQTIRGSQYALGDGVTLSYPGSSSPLANLHIKQEIQIPQVSSLTSSPDSSPSPIAVALGQAGLAGIMGGGGVGAVGGSVSTPALPGTSGQPSDKLWTSGGQPPSSPHQQTPAKQTFPFDSTGNASSAAAAASHNKISPMIRDFVQSVDDREWQNSLYGLLQNQTYNQCEVDLFELMCKVLDQNLFSQVDWARNSLFFKDLKVDDQMKLLQHSWSDMLVLDHMHQRMHNNLPDDTTLPNGQKFDLLSLGLLGVPSLADHFQEITHMLQELKFDLNDYICIKFLILLNPDVRGIMNRKHVVEGQEQVQSVLLEYCLQTYPQMTDKFQKLVNLMPEIHALASRGEEYLYHKHCSGSAPTQTLLMEMLHAKRK